MTDEVKMITGFTEEAKEQLFYHIHKANLGNRRQYLFELKGVVPDEYLYPVANFLKNKVKKLGYKVRQLDTKLKIEW